jgi:glutamate decarboxylase
MLTRHPDFELLNIPELFISNYRFVPQEIRRRIEQILNETNGDYGDAGIVEINKVLNEINKDLHRALRQEDNSFVSRTSLESTPYIGQEILSLRAVTINPLTDEAILREIVTEQSRLGDRIFADYRNRRLI